MEIQEILTNVINSYKLHKGKYIKSGEAFNIFNILGLTTNEVRLHSALLAELLSISGSHGMGDYFLKSFIGYLIKNGKDVHEKLSSFETSNSYIEIEYNLGQLNEDSTTGGRVDILIRDNYSRYIVIENKINAGDQKNQMVRYDSIQNKAALIYLTKFGNSPSEFSAGKLKPNEDFVCLSYSTDILNWLSNCLELKELNTQVNTTIKQYITVLKQITNQNNFEIMENEIMTILSKSDDNIQSAFLIANRIEKLKEIRAKAILYEFEKNISDLKIEYSLSQDYYTFPRIEIYPSGWKNHLIGFTYESGLLFGIKRINEKNAPIKFEEFTKEIRNNYNTAAWWLLFSKLKNQEFNINSHKAWMEKNQSFIVETMVNKVNEFISISKSNMELPW